MLNEVNFAIEGSKFMVIGMSVVFAFLIMLVYAIKAQAWVLNRYFPEKKKNPQKNIPVANGDDERIIAAIVGAISAYKNKYS